MASRPRVGRQRSSLPGHSKAVKLDAALPAPDELADSWMMSTEEMAPIAATKAAVEAEAAPEASNVPQEGADEPAAPKQHRTKAEKAYLRRKELLDKVTASATPYSKSHARRLRRAAKPANNLVASLAEVEAVLPQLDDDAADASEAGEDDDEGMVDEEDERDEGTKKPKTGGKGKEKLTAKKRQRVLTSEAARLPAIIKNESFAASPFATIRQHTLNTLVTQKNPSIQQQQQKQGKGKKKGGK
ncbi:hypothetical protein Rhopal_002687-T1 [Rhodotorula paludigena]|uniref:Ribosome biogenesis protein SLX9 n=1 Tax=Rhodotorula paludigena TaxID=86838 RepID=A0AAV5GJN2_9BASI|nr:hypothetical protein Rhopal_002687-T1 [Rhodotorula paludigena]